MSSFKWNPTVTQEYSSVYGSSTDIVDDISKNINTSFIMDAPGEVYTLNSSNSFTEGSSWGFVNKESYGVTNINIKNGTFNVTGDIIDLDNNNLTLDLGSAAWDFRDSYELFIETDNDSEVNFINYYEVGTMNTYYGVNINILDNSKINFLNIASLALGKSNITINKRGLLNIEAHAISLLGNTKINGIPDAGKHSLRIVNTANSDSNGLFLLEFKDAEFKSKSVSLLESRQICMINCRAENESTLTIKSDILTRYTAVINPENNAIISIQDMSSVTIDPFSKGIDYVYDFLNETYPSKMFNFIRDKAPGSKTCSLRLSVPNANAFVVSAMREQEILTVNGDATQSTVDQYLKYDFDNSEDIKYLIVSLK